MKLGKIIEYLEQIAPLSLQESYDNAGLLTGNRDQEIGKALITLDVTPEVMNEAIQEKAGLILAHHPVIFHGLKHLRGDNMVERLVIQAIKNDIALYAVHTNLDNVFDGVNARLAQEIGLQKTRILAPEGQLKKLVVYVPVRQAEKVRAALLDAGAGHIGNYSHCSFRMAGEGTFKALDGAHPYVGKVGEIHHEEEMRIETIVPDYLLSRVVQAMLREHPYEEPAYDIFPLDNKNGFTGAGLIGELPEPLAAMDFLQRLKNHLQAQAIRYGVLVPQEIKKVALCGGSGSFLMHAAFSAGADVFVTADLKYHDFFLFQNQMLLVDAGHYETEQFTKELLFDLLTKKFPNFALQISRFNTNPVSFL